MNRVARTVMRARRNCARRGSATRPWLRRRTRRRRESWNYEIKDGKRVPKGDRVTNADGSWREEVRQGKCITVKEKSASGEYKETRRCRLMLAGPYWSR